MVIGDCLASFEQESKLREKCLGSSTIDGTSYTWPNVKH